MRKKLIHNWSSRGIYILSHLSWKFQPKTGKPGTESSLVFNGGAASLRGLVLRLLHWTRYFKQVLSVRERLTTDWPFNVYLNSTGVGRRVVVGSEFAATLLDARAEVRGPRLARSPTTPHLAATPPRCKSRHLRSASLVTTTYHQLQAEVIQYSIRQMLYFNWWWTCQVLSSFTSSIEIWIK